MIKSLKQSGVSLQRPWPSAFGFPPTLSALILTFMTLGWPGGLQAQFDNFNDGNDTGWTRYDPIGSFIGVPFATYSFPNGGYRISTPPSPAPGDPPAGIGPARAGSLRGDVVYTDFYVTVDVVNWEPGYDQAFGIVARVTDAGLGSTDGYAMTYTPQDQTIDITRFQNEDPGGGGLGSADVTLTNGHSYRFVFIGSGINLTARIYELPETRIPLASLTVSDANYPSGIAGLILYDNSTGGAGPTDVTYDNYFALDAEPPTLSITVNSFSEATITWPPPALGYILEKASSITATEWTQVVDIRFINGLFTAVEDASTGMFFYRLRRE